MFFLCWLWFLILKKTHTHKHLIWPLKKRYLRCSFAGLLRCHQQHKQNKHFLQRGLFSLIQLALVQMVNTGGGGRGGSSKCLSNEQRGRSGCYWRTLRYCRWKWASNLVGHSESFSSHVLGLLRNTKVVFTAGVCTSSQHYNRCS